MVRGMTDPMRDRLKAIIATKALVRGEAIKLASGATATFYLDMRLVSMDPEGSTLIGELMQGLVADAGHAVGGMETGGIPVAAAIAQASHRRGRPIPAFYVRKKPKEHGTAKRIEGNVPAAGAAVVIVEDVTTSGGSALQAVEAVREAGFTVTRVATVVDRQAGARETFAKHGIELVALFTRSDFGL
jgi:orotate phosphoribosyltransferase